jgi:hypothetical protein
MRTQRWLWILGCWITQACAQGQVYGLVGKSASDANFVSVWQACDEEARWQDATVATGLLQRR